MNRIKTFLLCLVLLGLAGLLHHQWSQIIVTPASAANLSNGSAQTCNGTGTWHFVNPQSNGVCQPLTVVFSCDGTLVDETATVRQCNTIQPITTQYRLAVTARLCPHLTLRQGRSSFRTTPACQPHPHQRPHQHHHQHRRRKRLSGVVIAAPCRQRLARLPAGRESTVCILNGSHSHPPGT